MADDDSAAGAPMVAVVPAELVAAARAIKAITTNLSTGFASLDRDVDALTSNWEGIRGPMFAAGWQDIRDGLSDLLDAIADTTVALDDSAEAYLAQESVSAADLGALQLSLDL